MIRKALPLLAVLFLVNAYAQMPMAEQEVIADGRAAGSDLKARDEALQRALRAAIEKGVGTLVDSETMTRNFKLFDDRIYSEVKGYIRTYDVVGDNQGEGGIYRIKIKAVVALGALKKDIQALNIIKNQKKNPRIMILGVARIENAQVDSAIKIQDVQTAMEMRLSELKFPMVNREASQVINEKELQDASRCAALGRRYDAEVVITYEALCTLQEASEAYGIKVFAMNANVNARAISTDNARIICSDHASGVARGPGMLPTAQKALGETGIKLGDSLANKLIEQWRGEVFNTADIKIIINNINYEGRNAVMDWLKQQRGVTGVNERVYANNSLEIEVTVEGSIWKDFDRVLNQCPAPKLSITTLTPNRIDCVIK